MAKLFTKSRDSYHGNSVVMVTDPGLALIFCIKCFMTCAQQGVVYMSMYKWILAVEQCKINAENFHLPGKCLNTKTRSPKGRQPKLKPKPIYEVTKYCELMCYGLNSSAFDPSRKEKHSRTEKINSSSRQKAMRINKTKKKENVLIFSQILSRNS